MPNTKHDRSMVLRLTQEMFVQLTENRRMTGVPASEFIDAQSRSPCSLTIRPRIATPKNASHPRARAKDLTAFRTQHSDACSKNDEQNDNSERRRKTMRIRWPNHPSDPTQTARPNTSPASLRHRVGYRRPK